MLWLFKNFEMSYNLEHREYIYNKHADVLPYHPDVLQKYNTSYKETKKKNTNPSIPAGPQVTETYFLLLVFF